jgi:small GTP-binding protein
MTAEKRKICMLGATGVGKSSLVTRYVRSIFSPEYRTTLGVVIEKYTAVRVGRPVDLIVWDLSGQDEFQSVSLRYLRGASGYLLVADGTRRETIETALSLHRRAGEVLGVVPVVFVLNKCDLPTLWDLDARDLASLASRGWPVLTTSAKTGEGVAAAFDALLDTMLAASDPKRHEGGP